MLLGLIFLVPVAGPSFGAAAGAVAAGLEAFGVRDDFVKRVRDTVTPGTSALLCLLAGGGAERIEAELPPTRVRTIRSELTPEQQRRLRDALGDESLA
jgi:uncharacterized membrane protein